VYGNTPDCLRTYPVLGPSTVFRLSSSFFLIQSGNSLPDMEVIRFAFSRDQKFAVTPWMQPSSLGYSIRMFPFQVFDTGPPFITLPPSAMRWLTGMVPLKLREASLFINVKLGAIRRSLYMGVLRCKVSHAVARETPFTLVSCAHA